MRVRGTPPQGDGRAEGRSAVIAAPGARATHPEDGPKETDSTAKGSTLRSAVVSLTHWNLFKYVLLAQFYLVLALAYFYVIPDSYPILAFSGLLFVWGLVQLAYRGLVGVIRQSRTVSVGVAAFIVGITCWMYLKNISFSTHLWDLGWVMQPLYTTLYGHQFFQLHVSPLAYNGEGVSPVSAGWLECCSPSSLPLLTRLFSPFLLLLLPFYAILPSATTLFVLQSAALALPALLVFNLVADRSKAMWASLLCLGYAPLYYVAIFDFHTEAFLPFFILLTVYFLEKNEKWFYVSAALFMSMNQAAPYLFLLFLPFIYFRRLSVHVGTQEGKLTLRAEYELRRRRFVIVPALLAGILAGSAYLVAGSAIGTTPPIASLSAPVSTLLTNLSTKVDYALLLGAPLLFVPLLEPVAILPGLAWLGNVFFTNYFAYSSLWFQYSMIVAGFLFVGLAAAVKHVDTKFLKVGFVLSLCIFAGSWAHGSGYIAGTEVPYSNPAYAQLVQVLPRIPQNATVMASDSVFPALANRLGTYFDPNFPPDWIVIVKSDNNVFIQQPFVDYFLSTNNYTILYNDSSLFVAVLNS